MLLIIDNYDSFTYNLVQLFGVLGQEVCVYRNDEITPAQAQSLAPRYLVISPGPCSPKEAGSSNEMIQYFLGKIPILGVCLGHQCIGDVLGGNVVSAPQVMHGKKSLVFHKNDGLFIGLPSPIEVIRYHSLVIEPQTLPKDLVITAWTNEKDKTVIMGVRHKTLPVEGIQFHPESFLTKYGQQMLYNFLHNHRNVSA